MKTLVVIICLSITILVIAGFIYWDVQVFNSFPHRVKFSVQVPEAFNASAFSYSTTLPDDSNPWHLSSTEIYQFPYSINGTTRVGNTYDLTVVYYGGNKTGLVITGSNIKELAPNTEISTIKYNIQIEENNDNQVSTYDFGFYVGVIPVSILVFVAGIGFSFIFYDYEDAKEEVTTKSQSRKTPIWDNGW